MSTSDGDLRNLGVFVSRLDFQERKALITLARSQSIPDRFHSPILFQKVAPVLNRLSQYPPFFSLADTLVAEAPSILRLLNSSLTTGIIIVYALGVDLSDEEVKLGKEMSFSKELLATQTPRGSSSWNWDAILNPSNHHGEVIYPLFPFLSPLQRKFSMNLPRLRASYNNRIILPHYSRRGVSGETSGILLSRRFSYSPRVVKGNRRTFHRNFDASNITSLDVVHHYVIRDIDERGLSGSFSELQEGDVVTVRRSKGWRFLEDMGYVTSRGIPGEKITLVGAAARDAYLFASEPPFLEVEALCTIDTHQLVASGVLRNAASVMFDSPHMFKSQSFDPNLQSWRYRRYVDLDDVKSAGFYGRSREWVNSGLTNTRASLSPEPDDFVLNY